MTDYSAPWTLSTYRDGCEDVLEITASDGTVIAHKGCWLPEEEGEPNPPSLDAMHLMRAAPELGDMLAFAASNRRTCPNCCQPDEMWDIIEALLASLQTPNQGE